jgi:hypothetical protein
VWLWDDDSAALTLAGHAGWLRDQVQQCDLWSSARATSLSLRAYWTTRPSRRSTCGPAPPWAPRPSCAGTTRFTARCCPQTSCRWRRRRV